MKTTRWSTAHAGAPRVRAPGLAAVRASVMAVALAGALAAIGAGPAAAQRPAHPHGRLPDDLDCVACHTPDAWTPVRTDPAFDHARTAFELTGEHASLACAACHAELRFDRPRADADDCESCHTDAHDGSMTLDCASCHDTRSFQDVDGDRIHALTAFPLTGAHLLVTCEACHLDDRGGAFTGVDAECLACHAASYEAGHPTGAVPVTCLDCHGTDRWEGATLEDHGVTGFDLLGAHTEVDCDGCHTPDGGLAFPAPAGPEDCWACHADDYRAEHPAGVLPTTCADCHTVDTWEGATLDHALTGFALLGAHAAAGCGACHTDDGGMRVPAPAGQDDCVACHAADYEAEHPGGALPTTCADCHTVETWDDATLEDHAITGFALLGAHVETECADCHAPDGPLVFPAPAGQDDCFACHAADYEAEHPGGVLPTTCLDCHTVETWEDATLEDHAVTGFALLGAHVETECVDCHSPDGPLVFPAPAGQEDCFACHAADYEAEHPGGTLPTACLECHTQDTWEDATLEDHAITGFALLGAHVEAECAACHSPDGPLVFPAPAGQDDCFACHAADYETEHPGGVFPTTCLDCHTQDTWEDATLDHALTGFELLGAHAPLDCAVCHTDDGGLLFPAPAAQDDCFACHAADYEAEHPGGVFPTACLDCHTVETWQDATLDHALTGFELLGAHAPLDCAACHTGDGGLLFPAPAGQDDCFACHQADYEAEHPSGALPTTCLDCHTVESWEGATLDHALTGFELLGAHVPLDCAACHAESGGLLFPAPSGQEDCWACHAADYGTEHPSGALPTTCLDCHTVETWEGATLDHALTGFELLGAHVPLDCGTCHTADGGLLFPAPSGQNDCLACHQADFQEEHGGTSLPTTCLDCHTVDTWEDADFDHDRTDFNLRGAHEALDCDVCHGQDGGLLFPAPSGQSDCIACHQADYEEEHPGGVFPTTCRDCHSVDTWEGATFDHSLTDFDLRGAHEPLDCAACHTDGGGLLFPTPAGQNDCVACHQAEYDDEHAGSGFPTTCRDCHNVNTWEGATFDHAITGFELLGAHDALDCGQCHADSGTLLFPAPAGQDDCMACHQSDYQDEHAGSGFPTTCLDCHGLDDWDADFDHDGLYFPIYSGEHRGEWSACEDCHTVPGDFAAFSCVDCHEHTKAETDDEHDDVTDYVYESGACLSCHPDGRGDD